ncbi:MAG: helix-turn-helix domain-containing protein [Micromonosporaceae bacterium]|nr:helix-turn-helix domain-containing protein [Micromonosporaceae bacterium]
MPDSSPTRHFAMSVRRHRSARGWTQPQLAERCQEAGLRWDRSIIANVEAGRRASVSLQEVLTLAYVFGVPPLLLLFPVGRSSEIEILPGQSVNTWAAAKWFTGEGQFPRGIGEQASEDAETEPDEDPREAEMAPIVLYRKHDSLMRQWILTALNAEHLRQAMPEKSADYFERASCIGNDLTLVRSEIRRHGLRVPPLPADLRYVDAETMADVVAALDGRPTPMREAVLRAWLTPERVRENNRAVNRALRDEADQRNQSASLPDTPTSTSER